MKSYTLKYLAYTPAQLTDPAKALEFATYLGEMSQQHGWNFVEMHPVGDGVLAVFSHDLA